MPYPRARWTALLLLTVLSACSDSTAPTTGTLEANVVTTGTDLAADGYLLNVDGGPDHIIAANSTWSLTTGPGSHPIIFGGLAFNCDLTTSVPTSANVTVGQTTRVDVRANCTPFLSNAILYTSDAFGFGEVMVMRPDGSRKTRLTTDQAIYAGPVPSPDGQTIAVPSRVGGAWDGIYLLDRFGKGRTKLVGRSDFDGSPAWSPDGSKIAFRSELPGPFGPYGRIFVINRDGTGLRQLTPEVEPTDYMYDDWPSWSPDGTKVLFSRMGTLHVINADGTGLTSLGLDGSSAAWSPDGAHIAYEGILGLSPDGARPIFVADANGSNPRRVTMQTFQDGSPRWSADGRQLVFDRAQNGAFQIYKINVDGSGETILSLATASESSPSWSRSF